MAVCVQSLFCAVRVAHPPRLLRLDKVVLIQIGEAGGAGDGFGEAGGVGEGLDPDPGFGEGLETSGFGDGLLTGAGLGPVLPAPYRYTS